MHRIRTISFLFFLSVSTSFCQWAPLNSATTDNLRDVDLLTDQIAVIVGDASTILLTTNGGGLWTDINDGSISEAVQSVQILSVDTILVSTSDPDTPSGDVYRTVNGGSSWELVYSTNNTIHRVELEANAANKLYAAASELVRTASPYGAVWDSLVPDISGTTSLDLLKFTEDQVGHLSGNVSGFTTYSAYFFRTEDGNNWHPGDVFSFPNADAFTAMCFIDPDTALIFTNTYQNFIPSSMNHLIKIYDHTKVALFPGDTMYTFTSQVVNSATPTYMHDAAFLSSHVGFALGDDGNIHATTNGGVDWTTAYAAGSELYKVEFMNGTGYAVGDNGVMVKYTGGPISIPENETNRFELDLMPNPATDQVRIRSDVQLSHIALRGARGELVWSTNTSGREHTIDLSGFANGAYLMEITDAEGNAQKRKLMKVGIH